MNNASSPKKQIKHVAIMLEILSGGGIERTCLKLAIGLQKQGFRTDLILRSLEGKLISLVPNEIKTISFSKRRMITCLFPLIRYLRREKPEIFISNFYPVNVVAVLAKILSRCENTRLIIVERNTVSKGMKGSLLKQKIMRIFMRWLYPKADVIAGVSDGVSRDLEKCLGLEEYSVKTLYNGIIDEGFFERANESVEHEWYQPGSPPVILGVGRLTKQKDFSNLLSAFALLRQKMLAKLIIIGEGYLRTQLENQIEELGLTDEVSMPGFYLNPLKFYKKSSVFVLSSLWEGLPGVVLEALACGCPVVSTDCPNGPREILEYGKYGSLVPVRDSKALADAIEKILISPPDPLPGIQRAQQFSVENAVSNYLSII